MPRKRKLKEHQYEITTTDANKVNGEVTTTVDAPTSDDAINKAGQGNNNVAGAEEITVKKAQVGGPLVKSQTRSQTTGKPSGTTGMQGLKGTFESTKFRYDYTIGLPGGFTEFVRKTKGRTKGLVVEQREGRVYMIVESPEAMDKLMGKLNKAARSRTVETRDKARTLIRGIIGSVK